MQGGEMPWNTEGSLNLRKMSYFFLEERFIYTYFFVMWGAGGDFSSQKLVFLVGTPPTE